MRSVCGGFVCLLVPQTPVLTDPPPCDAPARDPSPALPPPDRPKFRSFFPLPPPFSLFLSLSLGVFSWNFGWCLKRRSPSMCMFGLSGCRVVFIITTGNLSGEMLSLLSKGVNNNDLSSICMESFAGLQFMQICTSC